MRSYIRLRHVPGDENPAHRSARIPSARAVRTIPLTAYATAQDKVSRFDRKTVEYFGLHEGEYVYQDLIRAIDTQMTPAMLEDICRGCAWYPVSACKKNICGK